MPIEKKIVSYSLNLEDEFNKNDIKPSKRKALSELVGVSLLDEIVQYLDKGVTPVTKGEYTKKLTNDAYKKQKIKKTGVGFANMQLTEEMLSSIKIIPTKTGVELKITDKTEKLKAYNHNKGDTVPKRQWMPDDSEDETFKVTIMKRIKDQIKDASQD